MFSLRGARVFSSLEGGRLWLFTCGWIKLPGSSSPHGSTFSQGVGFPLRGGVFFSLEWEGCGCSFCGWFNLPGSFSIHGSTFSQGVGFLPERWAFILPRGGIVAVHFVGGLNFLGVPHLMGVPSHKG